MTFNNYENSIINDVEYYSIGSLINRSRERGKYHSDVKQVYAVSNAKGIIKAEDFRENAIQSEDTSNYTVIEPGMFAYNPSRLNIGSIAMLKSETAGLVSPMYVVFSINENIVMKEYFEYILETHYVKNKIDSLKEEGARFRFDFERWDLISVPIPQLEIQKETVRKLNIFKNLTAELTAELTARKKQYEYYQAILLESTKDYYPVYTIPEIADTFIGLVTTMTKHYVLEGVPLIHNSDIKENHFEFKEMTYLDTEFANKNDSRKHKKDDVITVHTGDVGTSAIICDDLDGSLGFATIVSRIKDKKIVTPQWLCHCLNSKICKNQIVNMIKSDRNNLNLKDFNRLTIPIPPITEQKKVVEILNRFVVLNSDITTGLPAEIDLRQKQYEYYRDKLLKFKNAEI